MAQYNTVPLEFVEHTELARKSYLDYERDRDAPDDAEIEAGWNTDRIKLKHALDQLTPKQREVFILRVGYQMSEVEIADRLNISQQAVSMHYRRTQKKLEKLTVKSTGR